jgi:predicted nucleic acid-binding protein
MKKLLIYLDTSIISHLEQEDVPDKMADTRLFWEKVKASEFDVAISEITTLELMRTKEPKKTLFANHLNEITYQFIELNNEIESIAQSFNETKILSPRSLDDCRHIAASIFHRCDIITSWNFKHIVNYKTINGVKLVSLMTGYNEVAIYPPTMLINANDEGESKNDL